ncbi:hypothetical protein CISIN_1g048469mg, partial [Citrus sinensis]
MVIGIVSMADLSFTEALKSPIALGGPWEVYGSAWCPKQSWFPSSAVDHYITFDATNSGNTTEKLSLLFNEITHVHDPAHSAHANSHDPPLREDLSRLPCQNFYCALEDLVASYMPVISYSIHRSSIIIGSSSRSVYNSLLTLDVICKVFGVEFVPFDENDDFDFVGMMKPKAKVWDEIAEQHGLYNINKLEEITCFEALINVLHFGFQHVCSMNKSREFGFFKFADTLKSLGMWVTKLR